MKKLAVEWLEQEIIALENYSIKELRLLFNQAKVMEKENIIDAHYEGAKHFNEFCRHEQYPMHVDSETYLHSNYNS
jgi:hypothetical protein